MCVKMKILWSVLVCISLLKQRADSADYYHCYSTGNFTSDSEYGGSRDGQLTGLAQSVKQQGGFYYGSTTTIPPSPVPYCFGLCRKDLISSDACFDCVSNSSNLITQNCLVQKEVIAWGDDGGCLVQCISPDHTSQPYATSPSVQICNTTSVPRNNVPQFNQFLANITSRLADRAAEEGASSTFPNELNEPQYYATDESNSSDLHQTIYAVGYCVPRLSKSECSACLQAVANGSNQHCNGKQGATILTPSCVFRYEPYPFYESVSAATAPSPQQASPSSSSSKDVKKGRKRRAIVAVIVLPLIFVLTVIVLIVSFNSDCYRSKKNAAQKDGTISDQSMESCLQFSLNTIRVATDDFNESNKLGEGGFGAVYKGRLPNGQLIAVKRLTRNTGKREEEFKNEVQLVARLHHKNLIRLIGFSVGMKERILIYELAPNRSLDRVLFDRTRREHLTWEIRYSIILGIARGLLYLHEESQLRIIHRDLKASNILLDASSNAKISDFGTARLYAEDHCSASRIVGTYGYMPPEYAKFGILSAKVDVFSFGVLLLEIVSGTKNSSSQNTNCVEHLLSKAWNCWTTGKLLQLVDPILLRQNSHIDQITQCIHTGLLCVQENAARRPSMDLVILNLDGSSLSLPHPLEPAYLMKIGSDKARGPKLEGHSESNLHESETDSYAAGLHPSSSHGFSSINEISLTNTYPEPR